MAHNLKGKEYTVENRVSDAAFYFNAAKYFMENVTDYPWVIEEVSENEIRYYIDDSKTLGFSVFNSGSYSTSGIYALRGVDRLGVCMASNTYNSGYYIHYYFHVSSDENVIYIGTFIYAGSSTFGYGIVAAKDANDKWALLYLNERPSYQGNFVQADEEKAGRKYTLTFHLYNYIYDNDSFFAITKLPNIFSGTEFKSLYNVIGVPAYMDYNSNGLQKIFINQDGKIYRIVPLYKNFPFLAFPVSD